MNIRTVDRLRLLVCLMKINLILAIEQNFGIQFDFDQLENLNSIAEITKALENDISNK